MTEIANYSKILPMYMTAFWTAENALGKGTGLQRSTRSPALRGAQASSITPRGRLTPSNGGLGLTGPALTSGTSCYTRLRYHQVLTYTCLGERLCTENHSTTGPISHLQTQAMLRPPMVTGQVMESQPANSKQHTGKPVLHSFLLNKPV